jgi:hypothetical protein
MAWVDCGSDSDGSTASTSDGENKIKKVSKKIARLRTSMAKFPHLDPLLALPEVDI